MTLRYIALFMGDESGFEDGFTSQFDYNTRFISNYLSIQIRKLKYVTDGTFKMIGVTPTLDIKHTCRVVPEDALQASISFNRDKYEKMAEVDKYEYYLQLLEEGYRICSQYKNIPLEQLLTLHQDFRDNNFRNEWLHKKKRFKEHGIEVSLNCFFTSFDFQLKMSVYDMRSKAELASGTVIRTLPNEQHFAHYFKDIVIENNELIITEFQDRPKFKFSLPDIFDGKFSFEITDEGVPYKPYSG